MGGNLKGGRGGAGCTPAALGPRSSASAIRRHCGCDGCDAAGWKKEANWKKQKSDCRACTSREKPQVAGLQQNHPDEVKRAPRTRRRTRKRGDRPSKSQLGPRGSVGARENRAGRAGRSVPPGHSGYAPQRGHRDRRRYGRWSLKGRRESEKSRGREGHSLRGRWGCGWEKVERLGRRSESSGGARSAGAMRRPAPSSNLWRESMTERRDDKVAAKTERKQGWRAAATTGEGAKGGCDSVRVVALSKISWVSFRRCCRREK